MALTQASCVEMEERPSPYRIQERCAFRDSEGHLRQADDSAEMDYPTFEANAAAFCARLTEALAGSGSGRMTQ